MYSPSVLFQLQALQSLTPGKDQTRFNTECFTASIPSPAKTTISTTHQPGG
jgi:hypothetical protein